MAVLEQGYLNRLYNLMDKAKKQGEIDDAATLRWAIFTYVSRESRLNYEGLVCKFAQIAKHRCLTLQIFARLAALSCESRRRRLLH